MNFILIAIQPDEPNPRDDKMNRVKKFEKLIQGKCDPCHLFGYTWLTKTDLDPSKISDHLNKWLNPNDKYIVAPLSNSERWLCRADDDCFQF